jgi:exodeoxyribonuclease VII small subunit
MEEGGLSLEALMQAYEKGIRISQELTKELETAQGKLMSLKDGALKPAEDQDGL